MLQAVVSLDMYLAYLRAAFHTCYYCSVVTDHLEELQRKCLKHARKPLSKAQLEGMKAADAENAEKEKKSKEEDADKEKEVKKESTTKGSTDNKDWKRNGLFFLSLLPLVLTRRRR